MRKFMKVLVRIAIVFVAIFILHPILFKISSLEFANDSVESQFELFRLFALPFSILLTLLGPLPGSNQKPGFSRVVWTPILAIFSFLYLFGSSSMCGKSDKRVLFTKANSPEVKIILRQWGCGAHDSSYSEQRISMVYPINNFLTYAPGIDTATLDRAKWVRFED